VYENVSSYANRVTRSVNRWSSSPPRVVAGVVLRIGMTELHLAPTDLIDGVADQVAYAVAHGLLKPGVFATERAAKEGAPHPVFTLPTGFCEKCGR